MAQKTTRAENQRFPPQGDKSRRGQTCNRSCERIQCQKQLQERRLHPLDHKKGHCPDGEACAFKHDPNKKGKGRDDLVHLLRQVRCTETRKDGKGSDDGSAIRVVKVSQGEQTDYLVRTSKQEVAKGEIHVISGIFPNLQNSSLQVDADSESSVHTNTQLHLRMKRSIQHLLQFTFHRMMNDRCSRMTRPNSE